MVEGIVVGDEGVELLARDDRREAVDVVELRRLARLGDHDGGAARPQSHFDRGRSESGEQRNVDGPESGECQQRDDELGALAHEHSDTVAALDTHTGERGGEASGLRCELAVGDLDKLDQRELLDQRGLRGGRRIPQRDRGERDGFGVVTVDQQRRCVGVG